MWLLLIESPLNAPTAIGFLRLKGLIVDILLLLWKSHKRAKLAVISKKRIMFAEIQNARNHSPYTGLNLCNFFIECNAWAACEFKQRRPAQH